MKLEMVTIIACEVDIEVFTSDKMQVRFSPPQKTHVATDHYGCAAVCSALIACCPVEVHACLGDVECSPLSAKDFYQWEPQLAKTHVPRSHGTVIDAGWIAEMTIRHDKNGPQAKKDP